MSLRELNFDKHNLAWSYKEVNRMFWTDLEEVM